MKCACAVIFSIAVLAAQSDRPHDRKAILQAVARANESYARHGAADERPWSEIGPPHLEVQSIRFLSPTEAEVAALDTRIGGMEIKRVSPVVLIVRKEEGQWRVTGYQPVPASPVPPNADPSTRDWPVMSALARSSPGLKHYEIVRRIAAGDDADLVLVYGSPRPVARVGGGYWWLTVDRIGIYVQDRAAWPRVYQIAVEPGPNDDCAMRVARMTPQDLVLSCTGEKSTVYANQKFVYDVRAKALVKHLSYAPFRTLAVRPGPEFILTDGTRGIRVAVDPTAGDLRIAGSAPATLPPEAPLDLGRDAPKMHEEIGPHQVEGRRVWFGKTFYHGEGERGIGGFGYFDRVTRDIALYSPPEIRPWSVSAILVEPDAVWLALMHRGEYGNTPGGLLRWDRRTERVERFEAPALIAAIARKGDTLYLGASDGISILRGRSLRSYFVDRTTDGRDRIAARQ